jgi:hypothetical protein
MRAIHVASVVRRALTAATGCVHRASSTVIPRERSQRLRCTIKGLFRRSTNQSSLENRLQLLNPLLRGWGNFYKHASNAKKVFCVIDTYVWRTIHRWLRKKHPGSVRALLRRYGFRIPGSRIIRWREGRHSAYRLVALRTGPFKLGWMKTPDFALTDGKPGA